MFINEVKNYNDSSAHCKSLGGSLATLESAEENQQMWDELSNSPRCFFGIRILSPVLTHERIVVTSTHGLQAQICLCVVMVTFVFLLLGMWRMHDRRLPLKAILREA